MVTLDLPAHVDEAKAQLLLAVALFQEGEVSVGRAAEVAGLSYRAFLDALRERGVPAYVYGDEADLRRELEGIRALDRSREKAGS